MTVIDISQENTKENSKVYIRTLNLKFSNDTEEPGIIINDGYTKTYLYPIDFDLKDPVQLVHQITLQGNGQIKTLMRIAYTANKTVVINNKIEVDFCEYEELFKKCSFYNAVENAKIIDIAL